MIESVLRARVDRAAVALPEALSVDVVDRLIRSRMFGSLPLVMVEAGAPVADDIAEILRRMQPRPQDRVSLTWEGAKRCRTSRMRAHGRSRSTAGPGLKWCDALPVSETAGEREPRGILQSLNLMNHPANCGSSSFSLTFPNQFRALILFPVNNRCVSDRVER